jgi:ribosomal protein S18
MKQRSPNQGFVPGQRFGACERVSYIHGIKKQNPANAGSKKLFRKKLKLAYKMLKAQDRELGFKKNQLFFDFIAEYNRVHPSRRTDEEKTQLGELAKQVDEITKEKRFTDDFPSFAAFKHYFYEENLTLDDLLEARE